MLADNRCSYSRDDRRQPCDSVRAGIISWVMTLLGIILIGQQTLTASSIQRLLEDVAANRQNFLPDAELGFERNVFVSVLRIQCAHPAGVCVLAVLGISAQQQSGIAVDLVRTSARFSATSG